MGNLDCGVEIDRNGALAWVCPDEEQPRIKVVAEASSMEAASELCDFVGSEIDRLLKAPKDGTGETKTGAAKG